MAKFALIYDTKVADVFDDDPGLSGSTVIECPDTVQPNWVYDGSSFSANPATTPPTPAIPLNATQADRDAAIAALPEGAFVDITSADAVAWKQAQQDASDALAPNPG
ncbi:MAG: hypothetical protein CMB76_06690 [Euryarchaeota archaeon]|nr:hypothetical protein [Euryarchaeota archaeon]|tara:strand:- start:5903 stop:6223 length:321 start_codon:yes stop_codon:yes gene_type:complete